MIRGIIYKQDLHVICYTKLEDGIVRFLPSTFTSMSSNRPLEWLIMRELGTCTGPGPLRETWGPDALPLTWTLMGQPGTGILLNDTLIMCSQASAGTKETANLKWGEVERLQAIKSIWILLCIALWVNLSWNVVTLRGDGDFKITFSSIAGIDSKLHWSANWSFCHGADGNFLGIVGLCNEWSSLKYHLELVFGTT